MNAAERLDIPSVRHRVNAEEWQVRIDLAACYRLVAVFGWSDLVFTHITARVPGGDHAFLINPYGLTFDEVTASSLVKIDLHGNKLDDSPFRVNPAGFTIHSAIHEAREDAHCVLHTHTVNGCAVAAQESGVQPISQASIFVLNSLAYHDYEGVALNDDEKPRLVADFGDKTYLMLRNHGLLTVGRTVADAFLSMYNFESACAIQVRAMAGGTLLRPIPEPIIANAMHQARQVTQSEYGALAWPALLRKLERLDPGYRS